MALEYAYQVRDKSPNTSVFWIHAETRSSFEEGYCGIAEAAKISGWDDPTTDFLETVREWLCDEANGPWSIVVDDAKDDKASHSKTGGKSDEEIESLAHLLPEMPHGSVLVTSRFPDTAMKLAGTHLNVLDVQTMTTNNAMALLVKKLGNITEIDEATSLIQVLGHLPLALTQAAAFIRHGAPHMSISGYLTEIHQNDNDRKQLLKMVVGDDDQDERAFHAGMVTWLISFKHIQTQKSEAADLLSMMSVFDQHQIPDYMLRRDCMPFPQARITQESFDEGMQVLLDFSLIKMRTTECDFDLHRLVQLTTQHFLKTQDDLDVWKMIYMAILRDNFPCPPTPSDWPKCRAMLRHVQALQRNPPDGTNAQKTWRGPLSRAMRYLSDTKQYRSAAALNSAIFEMQERILGWEDPDTLQSYETSAHFMKLLNREDEAGDMFQKSLEVRKRVQGEDHPDTLETMKILALILEGQGRVKDAQDLLFDAVQLGTKKHGTDHLITLQNMEVLATILLGQNHWKAAEQLLHLILNADLDDEEYSFLKDESTLSLATVYWGQGRYKKAKKLQKQLFEKRKREDGAAHFGTLAAMHDLSMTLFDQGFKRRGISMMDECLQLKLATLGQLHSQTILSQEILADWRKELEEGGNDEETEGDDDTDNDEHETDDDDEMQEDDEAGDDEETEGSEEARDHDEE